MQRHTWTLYLERGCPSRSSLNAEGALIVLRVVGGFGLLRLRPARSVRKAVAQMQWYFAPHASHLRRRPNPVSLAGAVN